MAAHCTNFRFPMDCQTLPLVCSGYRLTLDFNFGILYFNILFHWWIARRRHLCVAGTHERRQFGPTHTFQHAPFIFLVSLLRDGQTPPLCALGTHGWRHTEQIFCFRWTATHRTARRRHLCVAGTHDRRQFGQTHNFQQFPFFCFLLLGRTDAAFL